MSTMPPRHVIAVACSDLHLSLKPPVARSIHGEYWMKVQIGYLEQLSAIADKHNVDILCAGDIFHTWNSPSELVNMAIQHLPDRMHCIPGNHDLPMQNLFDVHRSSYGTLLSCGKIKGLSSRQIFHQSQSPKAYAYGFPWGVKVTPPKKTPKEEKRINIAVMHTYAWHSAKTGYVGAPKSANVYSMEKMLRGYDFAIIGDNHKPFLARVGDCLVVNCGGFQRRNIDEIENNPGVTLLWSDGSAETMFLDTSDDKFLSKETVDVVDAQLFGVSQFLDSLSKLDSTDVNFTEALMHYFETYEVSKGAQKLIRETLENEK